MSDVLEHVFFSGELLSPGSLDVMDEVVVCEEAGTSSSSAGADSEDSLSQPAPIPLVESIDETLVPDIIAGTTGTSSVFQSAWVALYNPPPTHTHTYTDLSDMFIAFSHSVLLLFVAIMNWSEQFRHIVPASFRPLIFA